MVAKGFELSAQPLTFDMIQVELLHGTRTDRLRYPCFTAREAAELDILKFLQFWDYLDGTASASDYSNSFVCVIETVKAVTIPPQNLEDDKRTLCPTLRSGRAFLKNFPGLQSQARSIDSVHHEH